MSKHHYIQNLAEQIANKGHGSAPFRQENMNYPVEIQAKVVEDDSSIKLRAYQIYLEKGGSDLDNWLEAEQSLKKGR